MGDILAEQVFQKRQVAHKIRVQDILQSPYVKQEGEWSPNYIEWNGNQVSRVNLIGTIVLADTQENVTKSITVDDSTGKILVRSFDEQLNLNNAQIGDIAIIIGRVREYNNEKYIMAEIVKKIEKEWGIVRKKELSLLPAPVVIEKNKPEPIVESEQIVVNKSPDKESPTEILLSLIRKQDNGEGATTEDIISQSQINDAEKVINSLLLEGEIFEVKPGRLKVLE